ncbi:MAG: hypothetical protein KC438_06590 [Thermomicrobiales bacterium]|nr:hypothetical protein [Thermomicrobiales bacterium]
MTAILFESVEEAFAANAQPVLLYARIGGVPVEATEVTIGSGVDRPVPTCTLYCLAPRPETLAMNAEIEVEWGYPGATARRFYGHIPRDEGAFDDRGAVIRIEGEGEISRLAYPEYAGVEITGPTSLKDAFRSLCELRQAVPYLADDTTAVDGETTIMLGGEPAVDDGHIRIDNRTAPLGWLTRVAKLFGYRVFGCPDGSTRMARVSGLAIPDFTGDELTIDLNRWDYIEPRTTLNFRSAAGTSNPVIGTVTVGDIGRIMSDEFPSANGYLWGQVTFAGQPIGWCALHNFSGIPNFRRKITTVVPPRFEEGVDCFRITHQRDIRDMANYIEVKGARFTDADGGPVEIRAIPDTVPYDARLDPPGWRKDTVGTQDIVTAQQADWVRTATEVDRSEPYELVSWECVGRPDVQPGDVVTLHAPVHGIVYEDYWLMSVDESANRNGATMRLSGWRGAGQPLKAGNDCVTETVRNSVVHLGTETLSHYAKPSPDGIEYDIAFTVSSSAYSSLKLHGLAHGTNSIGDNTAVTGSKVEIWQLENPSLPESGTNEKKRVGSLELPTLDEELSRKRNYAASDAAWTPFALPMPGRLKQGAATMRLLSGEHDGGGQDDYEVKQLRLTYCGVGEPILPGQVGA